VRPTCWVNVLWIWLRSVTDFSPPHSVQAGSGAHSDSYKIGTGGFFPGSNKAGSETYHSPGSSVEVKTDRATSTSPYFYAIVLNSLSTCSRYSDWLQAGRQRGRSLSPGRAKIFPSPCRPDRLGRPPSLLSNGYRGSFSRGKAVGA
jgi:hypothetical protein